MLVENLTAAAEHLTGFVIVMGTLVILWGLTALLGPVMARLESIKPAAVVAAAPVATDSPSEVDEADDDLVVVAAVAAMMLDSRHRIVSIRPHASSWGQQGRREIHASHRIR